MGISMNTTNQKNQLPEKTMKEQQEKEQKKKVVYDNGAESRKIRKNYAVSIAESSNLRKNGRCFFLHKCTGDISEDMNSYFCICAKKIGGMFSLLERSDGTPIIITGPSWPTCIFCTVPIIAIVSFLVTWFIILDIENTLPWYILPIYISFISGTLISLFFTGCCNPGILERVVDKTDVEANDWVWTEEVSSFRPVNAAYCRECKVLIEEYE